MRIIFGIFLAMQMNSDLNPSQSTLERLEKAEQLKMAGQHKEALDILETLLAEDPQNVSALEEIADNELSLDHFGRAQKAAKQAIELDGDSYTGYYILGFLSSRKCEWNDALKLLQKANTLKPNNPEILRCLGWYLFSGGHITQGIVTLERSLNLYSENTMTLCDLGVTHLQVRNFAKAKSLFSRTLDLDPENRRARECKDMVESM